MPKNTSQNIYFISYQSFLSIKKNSFQNSILKINIKKIKEPTEPEEKKRYNKSNERI
jgi:hypothetical protein